MRTIGLESEDITFLTAITDAFPNHLLIGHEGEAAQWVTKQLQEHANEIPPTLRSYADIAKSGAAAIHITGLVVEQLPATPAAYEPTASATIYNFDIPHLSLASLAGRAYGSNHVRGGRLFADIFPKPTLEGKKDSAFGSKEVFDFHADGVVQPDTRPDAFTLHCLKNSEQAPTFYSTLAQADFDEQTYDVLSGPNFNLVYELGNSKDILINVPVIEEVGAGALHFNYYGAQKIQSNGSQSDRVISEALEAFRFASEENTQSVTLQHGEVLFLNNRAALHGRKAFDPQAIPQSDRRWLRRLFIAQRQALVKQLQYSSRQILTSRYKES